MARDFISFISFSIHCALVYAQSVPPLQWLNVTNLLQGSAAPMPLSNAAIGYDSMMSTVVIFGGESSGGVPQSTTYLLDTQSLTWVTPNPPDGLTATPSARSAAVSGSDFAASNRQGFILIGGRDINNNPLSDVWVRLKFADAETRFSKSNRNTTIPTNSGHKSTSLLAPALLLGMAQREVKTYGYHPSLILCFQDPIIPFITLVALTALHLNHFLTYGASTSRVFCLPTTQTMYSEVGKTYRLITILYRRKALRVRWSWTLSSYMADAT
jgi:hypothetical protein